MGPHNGSWFVSGREPPGPAFSPLNRFKSPSPHRQTACFAACFVILPLFGCFLVSASFNSIHLLHVRAFPDRL